MRILAVFVLSGFGLIISYYHWKARKRHNINKRSMNAIRANLRRSL